MSATTIDIPTVRADFPILARTLHDRPLVYLDNAATTQKPNAVLERMQEFYTQYNSNVHRGIHDLSERASAAYETARETVREFLHAASVREIVFTQGTTDAINMVAAAWGEGFFEPGDEILVTEMEHHSNLVPWQVLCRRMGGRLRVLEFDDAGRLRMETLERLLTPRTRLVAVSYVSNVLGTVNPVRELTEITHAHGTPVLVDAAQATGHFAVDVQELGCDFLACSGHKMYAGTGIGVLYGRESWLERMAPCRYGGGMVESVDLQEASLAELPFRFEAGTPNISGALELETAIHYLQGIGMDAIEAHEREMVAAATEALASLDGVQVYGPSESRCGSVAFNLVGAQHYDVAMILDRLGVAVRSGTHCAQPVMRHYGVSGTVRASFALYNTLEEVEALISAVGRAREMLL